MGVSATGSTYTGVVECDAGWLSILLRRQRPELEGFRIWLCNDCSKRGTLEPLPIIYLSPDWEDFT